MDNKTPWVVAAIAVFLGVLLSVFFFNSGQHQHTLRLQAENMLTVKADELAAKEAELSKTLQAKKEAENRLSDNVEHLDETVKKYDEKIKTLTAEIGSLTREIESLKNERLQKDKKIQELSSKVQSLEADKFDLIKKLKNLSQEPAAKIVSAAEKPEVVKLGSIVVQKSSEAFAEVLQVNKTYGFLVISAGRKNGLSKDSVLNILRGKKLVGKAVVEQTDEDVSAALILP